MMHFFFFHNIHTFLRFLTWIPNPAIYVFNSKVCPPPIYRCLNPQTRATLTRNIFSANVGDSAGLPKNVKKKHWGFKFPPKLKRSVVCTCADNTVARAATGSHSRPSHRRHQERLWAQTPLWQKTPGATPHLEQVLGHQLPPLGSKVGGRAWSCNRFGKGGRLIPSPLSLVDPHL